MLLSEIIKQKIQEEGPISFHDFMEIALYYPEKGYYTSAELKIGKTGDFYTSSNLTPGFGAMIGRQIEEMWALLQQDRITVVEYGAGTGFLCHDILDYLKNNPDLYDQLDYCIIEKSPIMREKEKAHLHDNVRWCDSIKEISGITGCILSNELLDNFAVHQVVMEDELKEVYVGYENGFVESLRPARKDLIDYLGELNVVLPKGFRTEVNLEATQWMGEIAASLKKGYVITIDYGYPSTELYSDRRRSGTLMCYSKHTFNDDPYLDIGKQDITSHVNFSALCHWGFKNGLLCCGLTNQAGFLLGLGFKDYLRKTVEPGQDIISMAKKESFITYHLLVEMGQKYKVLIQRKGIPNKELSGLKLS